ncbi:MAG: BON domain-containing protein [Gammaproteobacteria bacterium]|nr:BON domain-containing protein [Gammaproteobacteria bacterium]
MGRASLLVLCLGTGPLTGCAGAVIGGAAATVAVVHDRRTFGTLIEDQTIEFKILDHVNQDQELKERSHINVTSYNMVVLLTGQAPSPTLKERAGALAREVERVRRVYNEIEVAAPSSFTARGSDTLLTAKVKTSLFKVKAPGFDPTRIKVVTDGGTVYLMGLVSKAEGRAATDQARRVGGVRRVVKLFEYI